jgi:Fuc2NAc and GlcNAc transferase
MSFAMWTAATAATALGASWGATRQVRAYAGQRLIDHPNERSSHVVPTPRGGGLGLVLAFLAGASALALAGVVDGRTALALLPGTAVIAALGWIDDHRPLPSLPRFCVHVLAAVWAVACLGGMPALRVGAGAARLGPAGWVLGVLGIVWATNLYNFMDGIDGLAAGEAASAGAAAAALLWLSGAPGLAAVTLVLSAASAGFLVWNWQPARIFMGDVGSGAVGYAFGVLALASENAGAVPALVWVLLLGVFVGDATVTVLRRIVRREPFLHAHKTHAYQRAVQAGLSHGQVTTAALLLNLVLAVLAAAAALRPAWAGLAWAAAAALLLVVYLRVERLVPMPHARRRPEPSRAADVS